MARKMRFTGREETYYNNQLHRSATQSELNSGYAQIARSGLRSVPLSIVNSNEFRQDFALNVMTEILHNTTNLSQAISLADTRNTNLMQLMTELVERYSFPTD